MKFSLICIGKTDDKEISNLIAYYTTRLPKHWNFEILAIPDIKNAKNLSSEQIKQEEEKLFFNEINNNDFIILLDEKGKEYTSRQFSEKVNFWLGSSVKRICFLIGGAYGLSEGIYKRANEKISLSKMTFTHQMVRLFFIEQIYRASTILQGKPYHND